MVKYVITWVCIAITVVTFILLIGAQRQTITCVDGTHVTQKSLCLQCTQDSHCGPDKVCRDNVCQAKSCLMDEDCDTQQSACIFDKCTVSTGKLPAGQTS